MKIFNNSNQKGLKIPELTEDDMPVIKPPHSTKLLLPKRIIQLKKIRR
ncbi:MAG: hypothetical protein ACI87X_000586 [Candidatus Arcticimaribacter sp.]|jgi:hypothetical protein|tara:strand:+ start:73 stop:216 length:144 start_codon:yes stop_codon:yes gene_type:complete